MGYCVQFPSIINSETILFTYDSGRYDQGEVSSYFLYQKKREYSDSWNFQETIPATMFAEYLTSLAAAMSENYELTQSLRYRLPQPPSETEIVFASKIRYKIGKKVQFFSRQFRRVSAVQSKQYDTRWEPIVEHMDGSPMAMFNFLIGEYTRDALTRFVYARAIRRWIYSDRKRYRKNYMDSACEVAGLSNDYHVIRAIDAAWDAVNLVIEIHEKKLEVKNLQETVTQQMMVSKLES